MSKIIRSVKTESKKNFLKVKTHEDLNLDLSHIVKNKDNMHVNGHMDLKISDYMRQKQDFIGAVIYFFIY